MHYAVFFLFKGQIHVHYTAKTTGPIQAHRFILSGLLLRLLSEQRRL